MSTKTRFEKEAKGNSEMVYFDILKFICKQQAPAIGSGE